MKYKVFVSTLPGIRGQVKGFKVESNLSPWSLLGILEDIVKSSYHVTIKEGWKHWGSKEETSFDVLLVTLKELRFYKTIYEREWVKEYSNYIGHVYLPEVLTIEYWRNEDSLYRPRTFFRLKSTESTLKPDIDGIIKSFNDDCSIKMYRSKTDNVIWTFDDIKLSVCCDEHSRTDYYVHEAQYNWQIRETKIEL